MAHDYARPFYKSTTWQKCRRAYIISQHGICERCDGAGKIVHHIIEITPANINNPDVTLNWDNLQLLCQDCHNIKHHGGEATVEGVAFNVDGDVVKWL